VAQYFINIYVLTLYNKQSKSKNKKVFLNFKNEAVKSVTKQLGEEIASKVGKRLQEKFDQLIDNKLEKK
jgi:predicted peroxiredoxin